MMAGGGAGNALGTQAYKISYRVAPIVSTEVTATASSAHGAHHGQESSLLSCGCAMRLQDCPAPLVPSSEIALPPAFKAPEYNYG